MRFWLEVALKKKVSLLSTERASGFIDTGGRAVCKGDVITLHGLGTWTVERTGSKMPEAEVSGGKRLGRIC